MSKSQIDGWLDRELNVLAVISEIIHSIEKTAEEEPDGYDTIDLILDLLASAVISTVEEYLENEYDDAFQDGLGGWVSADPDEAARTAAIHAEVDGKTFSDRIEEYVAAGIVGFEAKIAALVATDGHRVRSEGILAAADTLEGVGLTVTKTWQSVYDGKERDEHHRLHGVTVPYKENFEVDGFQAPAPGLFGVAQLDCNCRCWLALGVTE